MKHLTLIKLAITFFFIATYISIYLITTHHKDESIDHMLTQEINSLTTNYKVARNQFDIITKLTGKNLFYKEEVLELLYQAKHSSNLEERADLRKKLYKIVAPEFKNLQEFGVNIMLFAFENNRTFLRVHKPEKFDDDLSLVRYSFTYVNKNQKKISGFEEGKISHAFRNITPLFYKGEYLGSVDLSFSSEIIQENIKLQHNLDTHFILNKHIFDSNIWKSQKEVNYIQSIEHKDFLFSLTPSENLAAFSQEKLDVINALQAEIKNNISNKNAFSLYFYKNNIAYSITFAPIKDIKQDKTVAYLVSYNKNTYLKHMIDDYYFINIISFVILLLLTILSYRNIKYISLLKNR